MNDYIIPVRSIQHYLYCHHRWGLLEIDKAWAENFFVTRANLMHDRVHNPDKSYASRGKRVFTSVSVYNDKPEYGLYGVTDCIEAAADDSGVSLFGSADKYKLSIVEYKPTKPKSGEYNIEDLMQVFAQKLCVDYVFGCDCDAFIYYGNVKKRTALPLKENYSQYDESLKKILIEIRYNIEHGIIPPVPKNKRCGGCSMKDICMPSLKKAKTMRAAINESLEN